MIRNEAAVKVIQGACIVRIDLTCLSVLLIVEVIEDVPVLNEGQDEGVWLEEEQV